MSPLAQPLVRDSVTHLGTDARGHVVIAASHGGQYAVHMALSEGALALIVCDAGVGLDGAGISGLAFADSLGAPCAAIGHASARIGDGADCAARGRISFLNQAAAALGVRPGMAVLEAARRMEAAPPLARAPGPLPGESRRAVDVAASLRPVLLLDSAGLVEAGDAGAVVLTGSHGGLLGGRPETAVKAPVFAALYNDAGIGCDNAGLSRLPALEQRGIAGATVAAASARIGEAQSAWDSGVISHQNPTALARGGRIGQSARAWAEAMARAQ